MYLTSQDYPKIHWTYRYIQHYKTVHEIDCEIILVVSRKELIDVFGRYSLNEYREKLKKTLFLIEGVQVKAVEVYFVCKEPTKFVMFLESRDELFNEP